MSSTMTVKRAVVMNHDKEPICIISLQKDGTRYQISFGSTGHSDESRINPIASLIGEMITTMKSEGESGLLNELTKNPCDTKEIQLWQQILSRLNLSNYQTEEIPTKDMGVEVIIDGHTGNVSSSVRALHGYFDVNEKRNLAEIVFEKTTNEIKDRARRLLSEVSSLRREEKYTEIEKKLLSASKDELISFSRRKDLTDLLFFIKDLDKSQFIKATQEELIFFMIVLAGLIGQPSIVYEELCRYDEEHPHIERSLNHRLQLLKAQGALQKGMPELAYAIYMKLLHQKRDMDIDTIATTYDKLANLRGTSESDATRYTEYAADAFLQAGDQAQASACYCRLADRIGLTDLKIAIKYFEVAEKLLAIISNTQKEHFLSHIFYRKSCLYYRADMHAEAILEIKKSRLCQANLLGNDVIKLSALRLAQVLAAGAGDLEDATAIENELNEFRKKYPNRQEWLRDELISYTKDPLPETAKTLDEEIAQSGYVGLKCDWNIIKAISSPGLSNEDRICLLEQANALIKQNIDTESKKDSLAGLYSAYGYVYLKMNDDNKALSYYRETLKIDPYQQSARQNCAALLFKTKNWAEAEAFFEKELSRHGDKPGILFGYGRALLEQGDKIKAAGVFNRAKKAIQSSSPNGLEALVQEYLQKTLDGIELPSATSSRGASNQVVICEKQPQEDSRITIFDFRQCIAYFGEHIKSQERMTFWMKDKSTNEYEWISSPEAHAKILFRTAINMHYKDALETLEEVSTGAGRIDLYLIFRNGIRAVVELKMCGDGYSRNYALEGHEQLAHYMENRKTHIGFLIVFDGRLRDYGKGIPETVAVENKTIYSYCVDVRHTFKSSKL